MRNLLIAAFVAALSLPARGDEKSDLAANMNEAKVPLERGIAATKAQGTPISAKYEVEDGKLQLSVYTAKGESFSEAIVNHKTREDRQCRCEKRDVRRRAQRSAAVQESRKSDGRDLYSKPLQQRHAGCER